MSKYIIKEATINHNDQSGDRITLKLVKHDGGYTYQVIDGVDDTDYLEWRAKDALAATQNLQDQYLSTEWDLQVAESIEI